MSFPSFRPQPFLQHQVKVSGQTQQPMLPPPGTQPDLSTRVDQWRQRIAESTSKSQEAVQNRSQAYEGGRDLSTSTLRYQTRLQTRISNHRAALAETSSNPRLCQQKASQNHTTAVHAKVKRGRSMQGDGEVSRGGKRPRGRPRKDVTSESSQQAADAHLPDELMFSLPDLSVRPSEASPRRRMSQSPHKRTGTNLGQTRTNANVTLDFLQTCQPSVQLLSYEDIRASPAVRARMPAGVEILHKRLQDIPNGLIPSELKVRVSTVALNNTCSPDNRMHLRPTRRLRGKRRMLQKPMSTSRLVLHHTLESQSVALRPLSAK